MLDNIFIQNNFASHKKNQLALLSKRLNAIDTFDELRSLALAFSDTLPGYFLRKNFSVLKMFLELEPNKTTLQERELASLQHHIEQTIEDVLQVEESYLPFLFTSASVSPLLGLFGTVWGLVHSFIRISEKQSADITTVAPKALYCLFSVSTPKLAKMMQ